MLIELNKIAREGGLPETEILNLVTYAGVRREPGGGYDEAALLKMLVRHLREQLYGCATVDYADKRRVEQFRPRVAHAHTVVRRRTCLRGRKCQTSWNGSLQRKKESPVSVVGDPTITGK